MTNRRTHNSSANALTPALSRPPRRERGRGFSLIEVLLAIFILGIGVISVAALFPAGIAQQRASGDDILGPTIANNAIAIIRMKVRPEDFGNFEDFGAQPPRDTITGDWSWLRPGFVFAAGPENGAINIFSVAPNHATDTASALGHIPYNKSIYGLNPPRILISQTERYYPSVTQNGTGDIPKPQYVWDCMFRKYQGKVLVAIFVYRVTKFGGGNEAYIVAPNPGNAALSPLPISLDLTMGPIQAVAAAGGPWNPGGPDESLSTVVDNPSTPINESNSVVLGSPGGVAFNPDDARHAWQEPRQWILDQNNNVHRVLSASRLDDDVANDVEVELVRAAPAMPGLGVNYIGAPSAHGGPPDVVSDIWYIPIAADGDGDGVNDLTLTPVYATVKEL